METFVKLTREGKTWRWEAGFVQPPATVELDTPVLYTGSRTVKRKALRTAKKHAKELGEYTLYEEHR